MDCHVNIQVRALFNHHDLVTRETASALVARLADCLCDNIEADFEGVDFISRSFADQFHKEKIAIWETTGKKIEVVNANRDIISMLKSVSKTQQCKDRKVDKVQVAYMSSRKELKDLLFSI